MDFLGICLNGCMINPKRIFDLVVTTILLFPNYLFNNCHEVIIVGFSLVVSLGIIIQGMGKHNPIFTIELSESDRIKHFRMSFHNF